MTTNLAPAADTSPAISATPAAPRGRFDHLYDEPQYPFGPFEAMPDQDPEPFYFKPASIYWSPGYWDVDLGPGSSEERQERMLAPTPRESWGKDVLVVDESQQRLLAIPLEFLTRSRLTVRYVLEVVHMTFVERGSLYWKHRKQAKLDHAFFKEGILRFVRDDGLKEPCTPKTGPHFRVHLGLLANDDAYKLAVADEEFWESSPQLQQALKTMLFRDEGCLYTKAAGIETTAMAIVPPPLTQRLASQLELRVAVPSTPHQDLDNNNLEHSSSGLMLQISLRMAWMKGQLALYPAPDGRSFTFHVFVGWRSDTWYGQIHGRVLTRDCFHCLDEFLPNKELLLYHYQQCCMRFLRGFSAGLPPPHPGVLEAAADQILGGHVCQL